MEFVEGYGHHTVPLYHVVVKLIERVV